MIAGMVTVGAVGFSTTISYLWLNVIGAVVVVTVGGAISVMAWSEKVTSNG